MKLWIRVVFRVRQNKRRYLLLSRLMSLRKFKIPPSSTRNL